MLHEVSSQLGHDLYDLALRRLNGVAKCQRPMTDTGRDEGPKHRGALDAMIELRDLGQGDVERLFQWRQEPDVDHWLFESPPSDRARHTAWFDAFLCDPDRQGWIILQSGAPCGFLHLVGLTSSQKRAHWKWYIGEPVARGRGAGRAAQALGLDLAFSSFGLQKVWSEVHAGNEPALRAQAAAGFRREGYLRRHSYKAGVYRDVVLLGLLEEEWRARRGVVLHELAVSGLIAAT